MFIAIGRIAAALTGWLRPLGLGVSDSIIAAGSDSDRHRPGGVDDAFPRWERPGGVQKTGQGAGI